MVLPSPGGEVRKHRAGISTRGRHKTEVRRADAKPERRAAMGYCRCKRMPKPSTCVSVPFPKLQKSKQQQNNHLKTCPPLQRAGVNCLYLYLFIRKNQPRGMFVLTQNTARNVPALSLSFFLFLSFIISLFPYLSLSLLLSCLSHNTFRKSLPAIPISLTSGPAFLRRFVYRLPRDKEKQEEIDREKERERERVRTHREPKDADCLPRTDVWQLHAVRFGPRAIVQCANNNRCICSRLLPLLLYFLELLLRPPVTSPTSEASFWETFIYRAYPSLNLKNKGEVRTPQPAPRSTHFHPVPHSGGGAQVG